MDAGPMNSNDSDTEERQDNYDGRHGRDFEGYTSDTDSWSNPHSAQKNQQKKSSTKPTIPQCTGYA